MEQQSTHDQMAEERRECIRNCVECHRICLETINHCLQMGGPHAEPAHIRLLIDCAQICQTSADFMIRGSDLHPYTCMACVEVCQHCADECERFTDDLQMQGCAQLCRRCAESCHMMAA